MSKEEPKQLSVSSEEESSPEDEEVSLDEEEIDYGTPVRPRQRFTAEETVILERSFKESARPSAETKKELANRFETLQGRIQIWFQNRRAKEKKLSGANTSKSTEVDKNDESPKELPKTKKPRLEDGIQRTAPYRQSIYYPDAHIPLGQELYLIPPGYYFTNPRNIDPGIGSSIGHAGPPRRSAQADQSSILKEERETDSEEERPKRGKKRSSRNPKKN